MRYFRLFEDPDNIRPQFSDWHTQMGVFRSTEEIYGKLRWRKRLRVKFLKELEFPALLCHPCFMFSAAAADVLRMYSLSLRFKHIMLFDEENGRAVPYQVPLLPERDCLGEGSVLSRDRSEVITGVLNGKKLGEDPVLRVAGVKGWCVIADLEVTESLLRRVAEGIRIGEYVVR